MSANPYLASFTIALDIDDTNWSPSAETDKFEAALAETDNDYLSLRDVTGPHPNGLFYIMYRCDFPSDRLGMISSNLDRAIRFGLALVADASQEFYESEFCEPE